MRLASSEAGPHRVPARVSPMRRRRTRILAIAAAAGVVLLLAASGAPTPRPVGDGYSQVLVGVSMDDALRSAAQLSTPTPRKR